jgi:hypothetical protein
MEDDPLAQAARGLGAFVGRGIASENQRRVFLELAASPFRGVVKAALTGFAPWAKERTVEGTALLSVCFATMLYTWLPWSDDREQKIADDRGCRADEAVNRALKAISDGEVSDLPKPPSITTEFIGEDDADRPVGVADVQFDTWRAAAILGSLDVPKWAAEPRIQLALTAFAKSGLRWLASFMAKQKVVRGYSGPARRMDWEHALGRLCGRLAATLPVPDAMKNLVEPLRENSSRKSRGSVYETFLDSMGVSLVDTDVVVDARFCTIWRAITEGVFTDAASSATGRYDPEEEPLAAAAFASYRQPVFPPDWQRAPSLIPLLDDWTAATLSYQFTPTILAKLVQQAPEAFAPDPGLRWLEQLLDHHGQSRTYWSGSPSTSAGTLLAVIWETSDATQRRSEILRFRRIGGRLADLGALAAVELLSEIARVQALS